MRFTYREPKTKRQDASTSIYLVPFQKGAAVEDAEGVLTSAGMKVAHEYAVEWAKNSRALSIERVYPELAGLFSDIRSDPALAREHAIPFD